MRFQLIFIIIFSMIIAGCASSTPTLVKGAERVKLAKNDPPSDCEEIGIVDNQGIVTWSGLSEQGQRNVLRNRAFEKGANYVRMEKALDHSISGTAFKCSSK